MSKFDKESHSGQAKLNMRPFEVLFLELGAEIMMNIKNFISVNPDEAVQKIKADLDKEITAIKNSNDIKAIKTMEYSLAKIKDIGGFETIVPSEGLVFTFKGKTYKYTGAFAPSNRIIGLIKYAK